MCQSVKPPPSQNIFTALYTVPAQLLPPHIQVQIKVTATTATATALLIPRRGAFLLTSAGPIRLDVASSATQAVGAQAILTGSTRLRLVICITALEHLSGHRIGVAREALESVGAQCWTEPTSPLASTIGSVHTRCRPRPRTARARTRTNNNSNNNNDNNMAKPGPRTLGATATCKSRSQNGGRC